MTKYAYSFCIINHGDEMKKYIFPIILSLLIGTSFAYLMIKSYNNASSIVVSKDAKEVYFLQKAVYESKQNMINSMNDFENYIYNVENNMYHVYVGLTQSKNNAEKIKDIYEKNNYTIYIEKKYIANDELLTELSQYDNVLSQTDDLKTIKVIESQIISKYKESTKNNQ